MDDLILATQCAPDWSRCHRPTDAAYHVPDRVHPREKTAEIPHLAAPYPAATEARAYGSTGRPFIQNLGYLVSWSSIDRRNAMTSEALLSNATFASSSFESVHARTS